MAKVMINNQGSFFLYEEIAKDLRDKIYNEQLLDGYRLPSEMELCQQFKASRPTVRRAIDELKREGLVEVLHGKGTFVKKVPRKDIRILDFSGFTDELAKEDNRFTKVILSKTVRISTDQEMKIFQRSKKFKVLELVRGVYAEDKPFSVDYAYFPMFLYPGIDRKIFDDTSTYRLIREEFQAKFAKAHKSIEFLSQCSDTNVMNFLTGGNRIPLISVEKQIENDRAKIIHYSHFYLLPSLLKFSIDIDIKS